MKSLIFSKVLLRAVPCLKVTGVAVGLLMSFSITSSMLHLPVLSLVIGSNDAQASERTDEERAIGVVKGFMHCLETGNSELCLNLLDTPYYQDNGPITSAAELRKLVEKTARGTKEIGLVEYSIHKNAIRETGKLDQAYIDVLARSRTDAILFRVKASDVFKIVGLVSGQ